jgi:hypothetical protein
MSQYTEFRERSFKAGADFRALQFTFVKLDTTQNQVVAATAASDHILGIIKNAPNTGEIANVVLCGGGEGTFKVVASTVIALGAWLTATTGGQAVTTTADHAFVGAMALEAATAQGDIIEVQLMAFTISA